MDLSRSLENNKLRDIQQEIVDGLWYDFHGGNINDQDEFYEYFHQAIENGVIYYSDCEAILKGNWEYHYEEHELWGKPKNIMQAAYACLYDYIINHPDMIAWSDMEEVLTEK